MRKNINIRKNIKRKISKENLKIFLCSFIGTLLSIIMFCGFIIVEKNTRYIAFGDESPFFIFERDNLKPTFVKVHFMGKDYTFYGNNHQ